MLLIKELGYFYFFSVMIYKHNKFIYSAKVGAALLFSSNFLQSCSQINTSQGMTNEVESDIYKKGTPSESPTDPGNTLDVSKILDIEKLKKLMKEGHNKLTEKAQETVIVIGDTGSGKSTIINQLRDKAIRIVKKSLGRFALELEEGQQDTSKIGVGFASETTLPSSYVDKKNNILYWDAPGFRDNRGPEQDIANAHYVKILFKNSRLIKILLLLPFSYVENDRATEIIEMVDKFCRIFKEVDQLSTSFAIIITKVDEGLEIMDLKVVTATVDMMVV